MATRARLLGTYQPGSPGWHELRTRGLGGSEIAAAAGLSPFDSPFSLWHKKAGNIPNEVAEFVEWGNRLEPVVANHFRLRHPELTVRPSGTYQSTERAWQLGNPDRRILAAPRSRRVESILEVKTARVDDGWGRSGSDVIPLHYRCQVMWYMDTLGVDSAWVAVLIGGNEYREMVIRYDAQDAVSLRSVGASFWASLQNGIEPPLDMSHETYQAVRALHPDIDGTAVELHPDLFAAYVATKGAADLTADEHRLAKTRVLDAMGDARLAVVAETPVLRRQPGRGGSVALYPVKGNAA